MRPGDSPGGTGIAPEPNQDGPLGSGRFALPVGESPTGTGGSPVLPIFRTRSQCIPSRARFSFKTLARGSPKEPICCSPMNCSTSAGQARLLLEWILSRLGDPIAFSVVQSGLAVAGVESSLRDRV